MNNNLTWLHISDIHFQEKTEWRDNSSRQSLLEYLKFIYEQGRSLRPDLIFCTGDIAFGETRSSPLTKQYEQAKSFFNSLLTICGQDGAPLPKERLFVVPGNHDVNRNNINSDAQETLTNWTKQSRAKVEIINQRFQDRTSEFKDTIKRLDEYSQFTQEYLPHQFDEEGRHRYVRIVDVKGLKIGIAGFNSAWTCAGPEDDRTLWLAAQWQFNNAAQAIKEADVRIGLIHHPIDWLNEADREVARERIANGFHFWLHGHSHDTWLTPTSSHVMIGAGAIGAEVPEEFGINLVRLDLAETKGVAHLHAYSIRGDDWLIKPIAKQAPTGQWHFDLPKELHKKVSLPDFEPPIPIPEPPLPPKREQTLFGREALLKDATTKLQRTPFLLVFGMRGNGKSALIEELGKAAPLAEKNPVRFPVSPTTTVEDLFRHFAPLLGDSAESPKPPTGNPQKIEAEIRDRYTKPKPAWVWIDSAHHLLSNQGFRHIEIRNLLLGMQAALGTQWYWVLELREKPAHGLFGDRVSECEVPGLDKKSLAECLAHAAPPGCEAAWKYRGDDLKGMYQWLGGGHGNQAHPLAIQLLIEVARGRDETPYEVLKRHRSAFQKKIEDNLLGDLFENVLNPAEQRLIQALALYRVAIPHDHADILEQHLRVQGAWDGVDRRCLLAPNADHSLYYLHSFIAEWLRTRLGYADQSENNENEFAEAATETIQQQAISLHSAIAACWLQQLGRSQRLTNQNITRALEAFHHLTAAGQADRIQEIAVQLLSGKLEWAQQRITQLYNYLHESRAPIGQLRRALEYAAILDPDDHKVQRFLGECWAKEEGWKSKKALRCFEKACMLRRDFPPYWANLGRASLEQGDDAARIFVQRLEELQKELPAAINDHVQAIWSSCLELIGNKEQAAALRMEHINAGSRNAVFYADEAKARLDAGDAAGALAILELAEQRGCANDFTASIRATVLQQSGQEEQAAALRMERINAGSRNAAFYNDEAKARLDAGDAAGALAILELAEQRGCADDFTASIRTTVLQQSGQEEQAAALRMERINAGSRNAAFYNDEAKARLDAGDAAGALAILELAEQRGCANDFTASIRTTVLQQSGQVNNHENSLRADVCL